ncbi:MAG TPA: NTP transferase domain-containing protein [Solirubrobacterales bacterium]|jgi:molybdopterin-guanine dinucleotide biosynthesis protein A
MAAPRERDSTSTRPALGAVLAGGAGRRLGGAKATAELGGRPLIRHPLAALRAAGLESIVVAKPDTELPALDCEVVLEPESPRHPLCGIVAALRRADGRALVVVACDMPLAAPALLAELAAAAEPLVVPAPGGRTQPLQARFGAELLPALEEALAREEPLRRTVESLGGRELGDAELARFGDPDRLFLNVNDEGDLRRAERALAVG